MDGWMNGWMDGWTHNEVLVHADREALVEAAGGTEAASFQSHRT